MTEKLQRHHLAWPRRDYKTRIEKRFRQLPCMIVRLSAEAHRAIHKQYNATPGGKPSKQFMLDTIRNHEEGRCKCQTHQLQLF